MITECDSAPTTLHLGKSTVENSTVEAHRNIRFEMFAIREGIAPLRLFLCKNLRHTKNEITFLYEKFSPDYKDYKDW